jgi:hypothetical protein
MDRRLAHDGLLSVRRDDLHLELRYAPNVADRVRELVAKEQACCAFLNFELSGIDGSVRLLIAAPERARDVADTVFEQFVAGVRDQHDGGLSRTSPTGVLYGDLFEARPSRAV